jgi:hypothetical protein
LTQLSALGPQKIDDFAKKAGISVGLAEKVCQALESNGLIRSCEDGWIVLEMGRALAQDIHAEYLKVLADENAQILKALNSQTASPKITPKVREWEFAETTEEFPATKRACPFWTVIRSPAPAFAKMKIMGFVPEITVQHSVWHKKGDRSPRRVYIKAFRSFSRQSLKTAKEVEVHDRSYDLGVKFRHDTERALQQGCKEVG